MADYLGKAGFSDFLSRHIPPPAAIPSTPLYPRGSTAVTIDDFARLPPPRRPFSPEESTLVKSKPAHPVACIYSPLTNTTLSTRSIDSVPPLRIGTSYPPGEHPRVPSPANAQTLPSAASTIHTDDEPAQSSGEKPLFKCAKCDASFTRNFNLRRHIRQVHHQVRPYHCRLCPKKFGQRGTLVMHMKFIHSGASARSFQCDKCLSSFVQSGDLKRHAKTHEVPQASLPP